MQKPINFNFMEKKKTTNRKTVKTVKANAKPVVKSTVKSTKKKAAVSTTKAKSTPSNILVLQKPTTVRYGKYTVKIGKNGITLI